MGIWLNGAVDRISIRYAKAWRYPNPNANTEKAAQVAMKMVAPEVQAILAAQNRMHADTAGTLTGTTRDEQVGGDHYRKHTIQPWDVIDAYGMGFYEGNALKYLLRWKDKGGVEDLKKARHYLDKVIETAETAGPNPIPMPVADQQGNFIHPDSVCHACKHSAKLHRHRGNPAGNPCCHVSGCECDGFR